MRKLLFFVFLFLLPLFNYCHYYWLEKIHNRYQLVAGHEFPLYESEKVVAGDLFFLTPGGLFKDPQKPARINDALVIFRSTPQILYLTSEGWKQKIAPETKVIRSRITIFIAKQGSRNFQLISSYRNFLDFDLQIEKKSEGYYSYLKKRGEAISGEELFAVFAGKKPLSYGKLKPEGIKVVIPDKQRVLFYTKINSDGREYFLSYLIF